MVFIISEHFLACIRNKEIKEKCEWVWGLGEFGWGGDQERCKQACSSVYTLSSHLIERDTDTKRVRCKGVD